MTTPGGSRIGAAAAPAPQGRGSLAPAGHGQAATETFDSRVGATPVRPPGIVLVAALIIAALLFTVYCLVAVWPVSTAATTTASRVAGLRLTLDREQRLFVVVALTGALGGLIHSARSLYSYVGNRILRRSWLLMYLTLPFIGSALAVVFYLILRGGLVTGTAAQVNFFGFAAISALVGLFSPEAAEKLKQIFSTMLAPVPHERDSQPPGPGAHAHGSADGGPEPQGPQAALPGDVPGAHREDQPAG